MEWETYASWSYPGIRYLLTLRSKIPHSEVGPEFRRTLAEAGYPIGNIVAAEQTHGNKVAVIRDLLTRFCPLVDALVTNLLDLPLVIRVADCGPIYFYDPVKRVIALAHSGKKGTQLNILQRTIETMQTEYGSEPKDISVLLGPCIRPPHYEIDFAAEIAHQASAIGVVNFTDTGICTASNVERYYSYRTEKGQTGRMWAVLMLE